MYDPLRAKAKVAVYSGLAFLMGLGLASGLGWTDVSLAMPVVSQEPQVSREAVQPALDLSEAFINVSDVVTPAVVRIETRRPIRAASRQQEVPEAFRRFFDVPEGQQLPPQGQLAGGSGFIVSDDGYILTNDHVVSGADQVRVYFSDRRYFDARVVGADPFTDVAVIKIDVDERLPTLSLGNSDEARVGEWVLAIGNPGFGAGSQLDYTVTAGIISARGRGLDLINRELRNEGLENNIAGFAIEDYIQTDAVINPGNSGGPMVDLQGRVVGINSAIASRTGFYQGYGFAIPVNLARRVMEDLIEYGHVRRPQLGVSIGDVTLEDAEAFGLPNVSGVLVQSVTANGPAAEAGFRQGDVIVSIEGERVGYVGQLQSEVAMYRPGDRIDVTVYRDRQPRELTVRLGEAPLSEIAIRSPAGTEVAEERLGILVEDMTPELADQFNYPEAEGAVITQVQAGSPAARRNLFPGFRIVEINGQEVSSAADVRDVLESVEPGTVVQFITEIPDGTSLIVNVRMPGR
jgi:serine protease Do